MFLDGPSPRHPWLRPSPLLRRLALRLDALGWGSGSESLWRHMAQDFDQLWQRVPLYSLRLTPLEKRTLYWLEAGGREID
jgi:hypothetical protein